MAPLLPTRGGTAMLEKLAWRMWRTTSPRLLWKFGYTFGYKSMRSVQKHKARLKKGVYFPPFLYISIINSCNLRCQGCWVKVDGPRQEISLDDLSRVIADAKRHGNSFFGLLGGEPTMHSQLIDLLSRHSDCYFQLFTNGQLIDDEFAKALFRCGNVTPLISIEGNEIVSDTRRGRLHVLDRTLDGLHACIRNRLITGVATSVCQTNYELVSEAWLDRLIQLGVHYCWFHTYRPVGADPHPELALTPEQIVNIRRFIVTMRWRKPIGIVDAYWDDRGEALCPAATGISHHINPWGEIEPCPIVQFARETIHDQPSIYDTMTRSQYLEDFRRTAAQATRGCVVLERPDLLEQVVARHQATDSAHRGDGAALAELQALEARHSQHLPGQEVPEEHWLYRFAKKHWFFGFGAYT